MTARHTINALAIAAAAIGLNLAGCTSLYHVVMIEMDRCEQQTLALRFAEARDNSSLVREALDESFTKLSRINGSASSDELASLQHLLNRAELEAWNLRRRVASVEDVSSQHLSTIALDDSSLTQEVERAVQQLHQLSSEVDEAIRALHQQHSWLAAGIDPHAVRSLQPIPLLTQADQKRFMAQFDTMDTRTEALVAMLQINDQTEVTLEDQARGRAAAR